MSGSQANQQMIMLACDGDTSRCLFAQGLYVAGDSSYLQRFSTAQFHESANIVTVKSPSSCTAGTKAQIVSLPYHWKWTDPEKLIQFENECLFELRERIILLRLEGISIKALFLELVLAGCGATLSTRFLNKMSILLVELGVVVLVDEIMTGGRINSNSLLLTNMDELEEFRKCVAYVTLGKWVKVGMVLCNDELRVPLYEKSDWEKDVMFRGSNPQKKETAQLLWRVSTLLKNIPQRRAELLGKLKIKEKDAWGRGLLIFAPKRAANLQQIKFRYLPKLALGLTFDFKATAVTPECKESIRRFLDRDMASWQVFSKQQGEDTHRSLLDHIRRSCCNVEKPIPKSREIFVEGSAKDLVSAISGECKEGVKDAARRSLRYARSSGLVIEARKGKKRKLGHLVDHAIFAGPDVLPL
jgi:hypothetical protein